MLKGFCCNVDPGGGQSEPRTGRSRRLGGSQLTKNRTRDLLESPGQLQHLNTLLIVVFTFPVSVKTVDIYFN